MSNVWFSGDFHWGHKNVTKWRDFSTEKEHREVILGNLLSVVKKRDTLWILGDSVFDCSPEVMKTFEKLMNACGDIRLTIGNHCGQHMSTQERKEWLNRFTAVYGMHKKYQCWLVHGPVHPHELRGKFCVHGHVHESTIQVEVPEAPLLSMIEGHQKTYIDDPRYFNMSLENHNYFPRDLKWLRGEMEERMVVMRKYGLELEHETGGHK